MQFRQEVFKMDRANPLIVSQIGPSLKAKVVGVAAHSWTTCNHQFFIYLFFHIFVFCVFFIITFLPFSVNCACFFFHQKTRMKIQIKV